MLHMLDALRVPGGGRDWRRVLRTLGDFLAGLRPGETRGPDLLWARYQRTLRSRVAVAPATLRQGWWSRRELELQPLGQPRA